MGFNGATSSRTWKLKAQGFVIVRDAMLQWSHVLTNVETLRVCLCIIVGIVLQWSHVLTNVETLRVACTPPSVFRFNGATSSRTWKRFDSKPDVLAQLRASMEPRPHERGNSKA